MVSRGRDGNTMKVIKGLLGSKKFLAALAAVGVSVAAELGVEISEKLVYQVLGIVGVYIVGQGVADIGKEKAKVDKE